MRAAICTILMSASIASASPWQTRCSASLDTARKAAAKIAPELAKVTVETEEIGEQQVKIRVGVDRAIPSVVLAGNQPGDAGDWQSVDETTASGEYHLVLERKFARGHALIMLTMWKQPVAQKLADLFRPALEACFADK